MIQWLLYSLFTGAFVVATWPTTYPFDSPSRCQVITVPMCRTNESKYDQTRLPNFIGYTNQGVVQTFTEQTKIQELVKTKCSKDLVFFLCSVLLPICISKSKGDKGKLMNYRVPPCRSLCESVYGDCIGSIKKLNFSWPGNMNCSGLPDHNSNVCITPDAFISARKPFTLKAQCSRGRLRPKKPVDLNSIYTKKNHYLFRVKFEGKKTTKELVVEVLGQSTCTSTQLNPVTRMHLSKTSCRRKVKKDDGEVLILVKKGKKKVTIEKVYNKTKKDDMKKALKNHVCPSKKRSNTKQTGKRTG